jgi:hypothetical protein
MIKLMTGIGVQEGVDGEFFWRYHITDHANDARQLGHPTKYSISRVQQVYEGTPNFFDIVEFWWTDRKSLDDRDAQSKHANPETFRDFERKGGLQLFRALVAEQRVAAVDEPAPAPLPPGIFKLMCAYELQPGVSLDDFVTRDRQHVERLAKKAGAALRRVSINPVAEKLGSPWPTSSGLRARPQPWTTSAMTSMLWKAVSSSFASAWKRRKFSSRDGRGFDYHVTSPAIPVAHA